MITNFYLRFRSIYGQNLFVCGNAKALGNNDAKHAAALNYLSDDFWQLSIEIDAQEIEEINYYYILRHDNGDETIEGDDKRNVKIQQSKNIQEYILVDTWNHVGEIGNIFYTKPFWQVLLKKENKLGAKKLKNYTHEFKVKAPLLQADEVVCITGSSSSLGNWQTEKPVLLSKGERWWSAQLNLSDDKFPINYKYGIYNTKEKKFIQFETGNDRVIGSAPKKSITILHDGFVAIKSPLFKGAGVAIPLFSLRSKNSFGTGEITDLKLLIDWAKATGLKLIQLLPINDTNATHSWEGSYPYAAISAFALHPLYLNLDTVASIKNAEIVKPLKKKQKQLNDLPELDYEQVLKFKLNAVKELYQAQKEQFLNDISFLLFFDLNKHWLVPYAAFCYLRDKYKTANFSQWKSNKLYNQKAILRLVSPTQKHYDDIAIHYFTQYHLHLQLIEAIQYAHKNGIIIKGDIPIGIYRNSVDVWTAPSLFNMDVQAGAPPDDFAAKGQNWGFPTYNWKQMQLDNFAWWKKRFAQMSNYFDAFRLDHILGFFRIWSIPQHAVEGILGKFMPAIPIHINELFKKNISFNHIRYCTPFINEEIINNIFEADAQYVKDTFLDGNKLKDAFNTQHKVEAYFANNANDKIKTGLYDLISNIILIEDEGGGGAKFHFRILMEQTFSFKYLDEHSKQQLKELCNDYFYHRQNEFWKKEAMHKLPGLCRSANMLVCGEDLGMVPACVPDVMKQLGILSLEVQRMPKKAGSEFFHPNDAPYLSVVTPSTHDMSTIRSWWEEDKTKTQMFYNNIIEKSGDAPFYCAPWISKAIILQHLHSPAMWSVFQLQDLLGISENLKRENPHEERINEPANPNHYWRYRMHLALEDLNKQTEFNEEIKKCISASGRI
jgi:4-alpha-glucanotransferase